MISFPNAKINIGLRITGKRSDGYHELETIFFPIPISDVLEFIPNTKGEISTFQSSGLAISGNESDNLCMKAYDILKKDFPLLPSLQIYLHKLIPMGAGLGGGSADGTFMLTMINDYFKLQLSQEQLMHYALSLGSDCPFFIHNSPSIAYGRGEIIEQIPVSLSGYHILIINPGIHINTKWAFGQITPNKPSTSLKEAITTPIINWSNVIVNDFEKPIIQQYPEIGKIKENMLAKGAIFSSMSGTGSTIFGIFKEKNTHISFPEQYFQHWFAVPHTYYQTL